MRLFSPFAKDAPSSQQTTDSESLLLLPQSLIAIFGLVFTMIGQEAWRYPSVSTHAAVEPENYLFGLSAVEPHMVVIVAGLAVLALLLRRTEWARAVFHPLTLMLVAIVMAFGYLQKMGADAVPYLTDLPSFPTEFIRFGGFYLFVAWATTLSDEAPRKSATLLAVSFIVAGFFQSLIGIIESTAVFYACSIAPIASSTLLLLHRIPRDQEAAPNEEDEKGARCNAALSGGFEHLEPLPPARIALYVISFICYGALCYALYSALTATQQIGNMPTILQLSGALGTFAAGALFFVLFTRAQINTTSLQYCRIILYALLMVALFAAVYTEKSAAFPFYIVLLDTANKSIFFLAWIFPPCMGIPHARYGSTASVILLSYQVGPLIAAFISSVTVIDALVFVACPILLSSDLLFSVLSLSTGSKTNASPDSAGTMDGEPSSSVHEQIMLDAYLSSSFHLTKRECQVLPLLEQGATIKDIAEKLVISPETAKTHRRNVLQKMGVSTIDELNLKMGEIRSSNLKEFVRNVDERPYERS